MWRGNLGRTFFPYLLKLISWKEDMSKYENGNKPLSATGRCKELVRVINPVREGTRRSSRVA